MSLRKKNGFILFVKDRQLFFRTSYQSWHRFQIQSGCIFNSLQVRSSDSRHLHLRMMQPIPLWLSATKFHLNRHSKFLKPKLGYGLIWDVGEIYFATAFLCITDCIMRGAKKEVFINRHAWFGGWWHGALWPTFYFHTFKYSGTWNRALLKTKAQTSELG